MEYLILAIHHFDCEDKVLSELKQLSPKDQRVEIDANLSFERS